MKIVVAVIAILFSCAGAKACTEPQGSREQQVSYFRSVINDAELRASKTECVTLAIRSLGSMKATEASSDLAALILFKGKSPESEAVFALHPKSREVLFPAMEALESIGKPAVDAILKQIRAASSNSAVENLTHTLMEIYRYSPVEGIRTLKAGAAGEHKNFDFALEYAKGLCAPPERSRCENAGARE